MRDEPFFPRLPLPRAAARLVLRALGAGAWAAVSPVLRVALWGARAALVLVVLVSLWTAWSYTGAQHEGIVLEAVLRAWGAGMLLAGATWLRARLWRPS